MATATNQFSMIKDRKILTAHHFNMNMTFIHSFIPLFIPLARAEIDDSLPLSGASSIPLCYTLFPATLLHPLFSHPPLTSSCRLFLGLPLGHVDSKFIYNTLLGILLYSILCTSPNQHNSISFHSLYMSKPTQIYFLPFPVHVQTNTILFPSILCTSPNQHNSISFHSLYIPKPTKSM
jgi:hypothetical protein